MCTVERRRAPLVLSRLCRAVLCPDTAASVAFGDPCPREEAHASTLLPPSAAFKLKNENDTEK